MTDDVHGRRREAGRFALYLVVGGLNTIVGYSLFAGFILLGADAAVAAIGSTILGILFNFQSVGRLVFSSKDPRLLPRFLLVYAGQCAVNIVLLHLAARAGVQPLIAQAFIVPVLAVLTFILMRRYVFGADAPKPDPVSP